MYAQQQRYNRDKKMESNDINCFNKLMQNLEWN